jgi:hypothetical protein
MMVRLLTAAIAFSACHSHPMLPWVLLTKMGAEPSGYQTYTYVFFSEQQLKDRPDQERQRTARNQALIDAIIEEAGSYRPPLTVYCIPAKAGGPEAKPSLANYNSQLGDSYRAMFASRFPVSHMGKLSMMRLMNDSGPFLVTASAPLNEGKGAGPILYTELTRADPKQIKDAVSAYRPPAAEGSPGADNDLEDIAARLKKAHFDATVWQKN